MNHGQRRSVRHKEQTATQQRKKACEFSAAERQAIFERDGGCIFCKMGYEMSTYAGSYHSYAHYISRAQGGLGIRKNGVYLCQWHHNMMDNGNNGKRGEMLDMVKSYLQDHYSDWKESDLIYSKWKF